MKSSLLVAAGLVLVGPLSPGRAADQMLMSAADRKYGAENHAGILRENGGAMTGPAADMLMRVGRRVAVESGLSRSGDDFTVTLLDTADINAFATLGGYIYATRGLLALMNDEAELAVVLGHEVGHVAKRHVRSGAQRRTASNIFAGIATITLGPQIGRLTGQAAVRIDRGFSRADELAADDLGVRYAASAGYDPAAGADALDAMRRYEVDRERFTGPPTKEALSKSDHPETAERVARARLEAGKIGRASQGQRERSAYLAAIDGLAYGPKTDNGVLDGQEFKIPQLGIAFTVPAGVELSANEKAVTLTARGSQALFAEEWLDGGLADMVDQKFAKLGIVEHHRPQIASVNGMRISYAPGRAEGRKGPLDVDVVIYAAPERRRTFSLVTYAPAGAGLGPFTSMVESVRPMAAGEAEKVRPTRVKIVEVAAGDTVATLASRMAMTDGGTETFLLVNDLTVDAVLHLGMQVKLLLR